MYIRERRLHGRRSCAHCPKMIKIVPLVYFKIYINLNYKLFSDDLGKLDTLVLNNYIIQHYGQMNKAKGKLFSRTRPSR